MKIENLIDGLSAIRINYNKNTNILAVDNIYIYRTCALIIF